MAEKTAFRVSVRDLVAVACPGQNLARGYASPLRGAEGTREHTRIQSSRPGAYEKEVAVSLKLDRQINQNRFTLEIFGRMDGLMRTSPRVWVEEIKTIRRDPETLARVPDPRHLAQLRCYGYMTARDLGLEVLDLVLTYAVPGRDKTEQYRETAGIDDLKAFFDPLVLAYLTLLNTRTAWERLRNRSIADLKFPYPEFRQGQRDLAEAVYRIIKHQKILFARAPTGTGKTMAVLYPAIKALGLGHTDKLFYLTAKGPGRTVAQKAMEDLARAGARIKSVTITAKQKICLMPDQACDMETCPYAAAYYIKLARAMARIRDMEQNHQTRFNRETIEDLARTHEICPFELSLDLALACDVIICDLNYAFDPRVYLKRFFDRNIQGLTFLMDEAHNLPGRLRSMYSADLTRSGVIAAIERLRNGAPGLAKALAGIQKEMVRLKKKHQTAGTTGPVSLTDLDDPFMERLDDFASRADLWLDTHQDSPLREAVLDIFFPVNAILSIARYFDSNYRFFIESAPDAGIRVRLFCLDPAPIFSGLIKRCDSAVFFSATFFPFGFYEQMLFGIPDQAGAPPDRPVPYTLSLASPFPREHLNLIVHSRIRTTFRQRQKDFGRIAQTLICLLETRPGNTLVFFSSYAYLDAVLERLDPQNRPWPVQAQHPGMTEAEREEFLARFSSGETVVGLAVMGGIFGEGIDLTGDRLVNVAVVGVGLPQVCLERNEIRSYYDTMGRDGFFTAFQMPGFCRVLQAAGRLIRTPKDRGVILLMDERFIRPDYQALFPDEWGHHTRVTDRSGLTRALERFCGT